MEENVKRLKPTSDTLRELYLKSGNQCAFPGCTALMIDEKGNFIGQVCHIEAAMSGGERFNKNQSNEDRRKFENLMLMCHEHHTVTNDINEYTVEKLRTMKMEHERRYTDIERKISDSFIKDYTKEDILVMPKTLNSMNECLGWGLKQEDLQETIKCISDFAENLKKLPHESRYIFGIICERVEEENAGINTNFKVSISEIVKACKITSIIFREHLVILEKYKMCYIDEDWDGVQKIYLNTGAYDNWWEEIRHYCNNKNISLFQMILNLNFSALD